jgi:glycosyltransferase involved in cell wall biosynthesis
MQKTNINIIPHLANGHTNNTIHHKLFQIMLSKSLLLVSSCMPLKRIVNKYDAGVIFKAEDKQDFAKKVIEIYQNYEKYQEKTLNAFDAVINKEENWENTSKELIKLYQNI